MSWRCAVIVMSGLTLGLAACRTQPKDQPDLVAAGAPHAHAPVDPALSLAVVLPFANLALLRIDSLRIRPTEPDLSGDAWVLAVGHRAENARNVIASPSAFADGGFEAVLHPIGKDSSTTLWYRPELGLECELAEGDPARARAICAGLQRVDGGLYVPLGDTPDLEFKLANGRHAHVIVSPDAPRPHDPSIPIVDRGDLSDGTWRIDHPTNNRYLGAVRRTIAGRTRWCDPAATDALPEATLGVTLCRALESVTPPAQPDRPAPPLDAPPADAGPPPFVFTGPPSGEALARAFVAALPAADEATLRTLLITPELSRAVYACDDRPDYPVDDRVRATMAAALAPSLAYGKQLAAAHATIDLGTWHETWQQTHAAHSEVTFVCRARVATVVGAGVLSFTVRAPDRPAKIMLAHFIFLVAGDTAHVESVTIE